MNKPIVSTSIGAEGIAVSSGDNIILSDSPDEFAAQTVHLLRDEAAREKLARNGHELATEIYDWQAIAARLIDSYESIVDHKN